MMDSMFNRPQSLFDQLDSLQRALSAALSQDGLPDSIRSVSAGRFPALNVARTADTLEVYAFAPGVEGASIDVTVERGTLKISGERKPLPEASGRYQYAAERPHGRFHRALTLPEDVDTSKVEAKYRDGLLCVSLGLRDTAKPQRIHVQ